MFWGGLQGMIPIIPIDNGKNGENGGNGKNGENGENGENGQGRMGQSPYIHIYGICTNTNIGGGSGCGQPFFWLLTRSGGSLFPTCLLP